MPTFLFSSSDSRCACFMSLSDLEAELLRCLLTFTFVINTGVRPLEVVLAVVITRSMLIIAQSLIMLMMVYGLFGLQLEGSVFMVILVVSFEGLAGLSYGKTLVFFMCYAMLHMRTYIVGSDHETRL